MERPEQEKRRQSTKLIRACNSASIKMSANLKSSEDPRSCARSRGWLRAYISIYSPLAARLTHDLGVSIGVGSRSGELSSRRDRELEFDESEVSGRGSIPCPAVRRKRVRRRVKHGSIHAIYVNSPRSIPQDGETVAGPHWLRVPVSRKL